MDALPAAWDHQATQYSTGKPARQLMSRHKGLAKPAGQDSGVRADIRYITRVRYRFDMAGG
jgi:hypothetical protein